MTRPFVMVAPNGARKGKGDHDSLPISIPETVATAAACYQAGANGLHLHIRDANGQHSLDVGLYQEALAELALQVPQLKVQVTTEAAGIFDVPAQLHCLTQLKPSWASVSVREIARSPELAEQVYGVCAEQNTQVQHILYDTADIAQLKTWQAQGIVQPHQNSVLFVLGRYSQGQVSSPEDLTPLRAALPDIENWMVCAFGPEEHECLLHAAKQGGGVRVGFENSLLSSSGERHADNAASVAALIQKIEQLKL